MFLKELNKRLKAVLTDTRGFFIQKLGVGRRRAFVSLRLWQKTTKLHCS